MPAACQGRAHPQWGHIEQGLGHTAVALCMEQGMQHMACGTRHIAHGTKHVTYSTWHTVHGKLHMACSTLLMASSAGQIAHQHSAWHTAALSRQPVAWHKAQHTAHGMARSTLACTRHTTWHTAHGTWHMAQASCRRASLPASMPWISVLLWPHSGAAAAQLESKKVQQLQRAAASHSAAGGFQVTNPC